ARLGQVRLERASAATDGVNRISRFIGAPLSGVLIGMIGASNLLWVDAATFLVSPALSGTLVPLHPRPSAAVKGAADEASPTSGGAAALRRHLAGLHEGTSFHWHDRLLFSLIATVTNLLDAGLSSVLLPASLKQYSSQSLSAH